MRLFRDTSAFPAHLRRARPVDSGVGVACPQPRAPEPSVGRFAATQGRVRAAGLSVVDDNLQARMLARMGSDLEEADRVRFRMSGMLMERPEHSVVLVPPGSRVTPISPGLAFVEQDGEPTDYASALRWLYSRQRYVDPADFRHSVPEFVDVPVRGEMRRFYRPGLTRPAAP